MNSIPLTFVVGAKRGNAGSSGRSQARHTSATLVYAPVGFNAKLQSLPAFHKKPSRTERSTVCGNLTRTGGEGQGITFLHVTPPLLPDSPHHPPTREPKFLFSRPCRGAFSMSQTWTQAHLGPRSPQVGSVNVSLPEFQDVSHQVPRQITLPPFHGTLTPRTPVPYAPSRWGCKGHSPALRQQMSTVPCHDPPVTTSLVGNLICSRTPDVTAPRGTLVPSTLLAKGKAPLLPHYISLPKARKRHGFCHHWDGLGLGLGLGALPKT